MDVFDEDDRRAFLSETTEKLADGVDEDKPAFFGGSLLKSPSKREVVQLCFRLWLRDGVAVLWRATDKLLDKRFEVVGVNAREFETRFQCLGSGVGMSSSLFNKVEKGAEGSVKESVVCKGLKTREPLQPCHGAYVGQHSAFADPFRSRDKKRSA